MLVAGATGGVGQILTAKLLEVCVQFHHLHMLLKAGLAGNRMSKVCTRRLLTWCAWPMQRGYKVRAMTRSREKASQLLGEKEGLEVIVADAKDPQSLSAAVQGITAVAAVTGTTAFPSKK